MLLNWRDYNGSDAAIAGAFRQQWTQLETQLRGMPLHLKASDQAGLQGNAIFDPVGTNQAIADRLLPLGWQQKIGLPLPFRFLGTDVDFGKDGVILEVQFSNYPFLLNNTLRSELFFRAQTVFHRKPTGLVVIVTKGGMFPSSNSTLYYEQAISQLSALSEHKVFTVPIRLVGLLEDRGDIDATWTDYSAARYSRTIASRTVRKFRITQGRSNRCRIDAV